MSSDHPIRLRPPRRSWRWKPLIVLCLIMGVWLGKSEGAEMTLRIMAYNIHHGADFRGLVDLERTAQTILTHAPDILFLSEVDQHWRRSGFVDQAEYLARATQMPHRHFAPALETRSPMMTNLGQSARYGNLILSKLPLQETGVAPLPRHGKNEPRNVLWADIQIGGRTVRLFGTHLSVVSKEREAQLQALGELIKASPYPSVLVGDFNSPPERLKKEAPYLWASTWHDAHTAIGEGQGLTFPTPSPSSRIDYIFLHDELLPWLTSASTPSSDASDHLPVIVELSASS